MKKLLFAVLFTLVSIQSFGWGAKGHKIVAEFAKQALSANQQVIDSIQYYLGTMTFQEASVWMDEVRSDASYDYLKPRHYVNVERDATYVKTKDENAVNELEVVISILSAKGPRDKDKIAMALRELFHLVGDLHQPLHCGYAEDKGGNSVSVSYGDSQNLHSMWDTGLIKEENIGLKDCLQFSNTLSKAEIQQIQQINVVKWMEESREFLPFVYGFEKGKITSEYAAKAKPIIEKQLVRAGIRLAAVLFRTFKR
ncbi:MAG: S1/P1 nuclease [Bacteroidia bacterium]|nr:S1/P1 nuclease [Bacteroidia bacterium]